MPGAGRKQFTRERATSSDVQNYLMDQAVMVFASASARAAAISSPSEGMTTYLRDVDRLDIFDGTAWQVVGYAKTVRQFDSVGTTSDGNGTHTFNHVLGVIPKVQLTLTSSPVQNVAKLCVGAKSTTQVQVVQYNSTTGAQLANNPMYYDWTVER